MTVIGVDLWKGSWLYVAIIFSRSDGKVWEGLCIQRDGKASCDTRQVACFGSTFLEYET